MRYACGWSCLLYISIFLYKKYTMILPLTDIFKLLFWHRKSRKMKIGNIFFVSWRFSCTKKLILDKKSSFLKLVLDFFNSQNSRTSYPGKLSGGLPGPPITSSTDAFRPVRSRQRGYGTTQMTRYAEQALQSQGFPKKYKIFCIEISPSVAVSYLYRAPGPQYRASQSRVMKMGV